MLDQGRRFIARGGEDDVEDAIFQALGQFIGRVFEQLESHFRVRTLKAHDQARQNVKRDRGDRANRESSPHLVLERGHRATGIGEFGQNLARIFEQRSAGLSQNHRAREAIEQLLVELGFQLLDLLTQRRLRYARSAACETPPHAATK